MWGTVLAGGVIAFVINVILWIIAVRIFSGVYQARFDTVIQVIHEGMAERDMKFRELQAMVSRAIVTDTRLFDVMMEDEDIAQADNELNRVVEERTHGREENNQG